MPVCVRVRKYAHGELFTMKTHAQQRVYVAFGASFHANGFPFLPEDKKKNEYKIQLCALLESHAYTSMDNHSTSMEEQQHSHNQNIVLNARCEYLCAW